MKSNIITVIPVYNGEKFIRQTLESVAKQTLRPDRLIVISADEGPTNFDSWLWLLLPGYGLAMVMLGMAGYLHRRQP